MMNDAGTLMQLEGRTHTQHMAIFWTYNIYVVNLKKRTTNVMGRP